MGRIVAIAGGELDTTHSINKYIVELAGKENARFVFIGTASHDAEGYVSGIQKGFESLGCIVSALRLTTETHTDEEINSILNQADIIYVGGGDTAFMMEIWKKHGIDDKLKQIFYKNQAVLSGISAGAMCWFRCGHSDSAAVGESGNVAYGWLKDLLALYPYAFCPHYNERSEIVDTMIGDARFPVMALENNAAFVDCDGCIGFIASDSQAKAYIINETNGVLDKQEQKVTVL